MFRKLIIAAVAASAVTPAAFAADLIIPNSPPVTFSSSGFDWTGFYAGLAGGYSWGHTTYSTATSNDATDPNGGLFGAVVGFNGQFDQFVLGAEGEILWTGAKGSKVVAPNTLETKSDWQGAIKLRAGVAFDQVLVYAHGGLAFADLKSKVYNTASGAVQASLDTSRTGYTIGAGLEVAVTDNVSAKLEYAYSDFGKFNGTLSGPAGNFPTDIHYTSHAVKAGVNFHF